MRIKTIISTLLIICSPFNRIYTNYDIHYKVESKVSIINNVEPICLKPIMPTDYKKKEPKVEKKEEQKVIKKEKHVENVKKLTTAEVDLISRVVMAEAEGEPMEGKIYVIDTILNRVESEHFPNTVYDVIYQKNQFTSMWNGRYDRCKSNSELNEIIQKEYINRKNSDVVFFTAHEYGQYGRPSFVVANHYFSTYV